MVKQRERLLGTYQSGREDHSMEGYVVFTHKLVELYLFLVHPPELPFLNEVRCNAQISYWGIKPNIEHLLLELFQRHRCTPFEITSNASLFESLIKPGLAHVDGILTPTPLFGSLV
jgi:hypothetical protein